MPQDKVSRSRTERHAIAAERVFDGQHWHPSAAIIIQGSRIEAITSLSELPIDLSRREMPPGTFLVPGFIDLQVNGGGGVLLNDDPTPETMRAIARAHRQYGTTACLPTFITDTRSRTVAAVAAAREAAGAGGVLGLHLEGPFISPARPGIHNPERIRNANSDDFNWLTGLRDIPCSIVTLAPECVPVGFVANLVGWGVRVCAGHSEAPTTIIMRAIEEGLSGITHLYNAMPPLSGREPGVVGCALSNPLLKAGIIVDGIHVDPVAIRAAFSAKGSDGIFLVTDAMPTVGTQLDGFELMGRRISRSSGKLLSENGTLAGAHLDMASAVRNAVKLAGIALDEALIAASRTPATFLGIEDVRGTLRTGAHADIVALTSSIEVIATWIDGEINSECR